MPQRESRNGGGARAAGCAPAPAEARTRCLGRRRAPTSHQTCPPAARPADENKRRIASRMCQPRAPRSAAGDRAAGAEGGGEQRRERCGRKTHQELCRGIPTKKGRENPPEAEIPRRRAEARQRGTGAAGGVAARRAVRSARCSCSCAGAADRWGAAPSVRLTLRTCCSS